MHSKGLAHVGLTFSSTTNNCDDCGGGGDSNDFDIDRNNRDSDGDAMISALPVIVTEFMCTCVGGSGGGNSMSTTMVMKIVVI